MQLEQGSSVDRYVVEGLIGQGGVASVYRVRHSGLGTVHALKVVHVPSPAVTERLLREGRVQGRLRHPNVVSVTDLITVRGAPGLVMELVPGPALDQFLDDHSLSLDEADLLARGVLAGVAAAHRVGLVHRDLKPGNILVDVADGQVIPRIVDFGLAKVLSAEPESPLATRAGSSLGTPAYMAPEQITDASTVDERADVFALGAILYELLTSERAFRGSTVTEVQDRIRAGLHEPIPVAIPARMHRAITGALALDPMERTPSVAALQQQWTDRTAPPRVVWSAQALERASQPAPALGQPANTPSTSTFADESKHTTHDTWTEEVPPLASTVEDVPRAAPQRAERRAGWWLGAVVALVGVGVLGSLWLRPAESSQVLDVHQVPRISTDEAVQRQFVQSWEAFVAADFAEAERRLRDVRTAASDQPLPHVLASAALFFAGDVPEGIDAMTKARTLVANGATGPGSELVATYRELLVRGDSVGPELEAYVEAHPRDYLAKILGAQFCSSTSKVEVCEGWHGRLLAHDDQQVVAHAAIVRSWLDLGELDRARDATEAGLAIDPGEPGLLALQGHAWIAQGEVDKAREAYERALRADPRRRGPKLGLARVALLTDDGSWDRVTAELLAPTVPAAERVELHLEAAEALHALGRIAEALDQVDRAVAIEEAEGSPLGVLTALSKKSPLLRLRGDLDQLAALVDRQLLLVSGSPEIPNPVRNRYAAYSPWVAGLVAAEAGDHQELDRAIERVERSEVPLQGVVEALRRERAILAGDLDGVRQSASFFWTACDRHTALGEAFRRAGAPEEAAAEWSQVLHSPCRLHRPERVNLVLAHLGLAEQALAADQPEVVAEHLAEVDRLWPRPDDTLPTTGRIQALRPAGAQEGALPRDTPQVHEGEAP